MLRIVAGIDQTDSYAARWPRSLPTSAVACSSLVLLVTIFHAVFPLWSACSKDPTSWLVATATTVAVAVRKEPRRQRQRDDWAEPRLDRASVVGGNEQRGWREEQRGKQGKRGKQRRIQRRKHHLQICHDRPVQQVLILESKHSVHTIIQCLTMPWDRNAQREPKQQGHCRLHDTCHTSRETKCACSKC